MTKKGSKSNSNSKLIFILLIIGIIAFAFYMISNRSYYSHKHPILDKIRENFARLNEEYTKIPLRYGNSAFTENKSVITLCLKDPKTGKYYDMNTIMYVALHELSHMISRTHGHNDEFRDNFADILRQASAVGIYNPNIPIPDTYCGVSS